MTGNWKRKSHFKLSIKHHKYVKNSLPTRPVLDELTVVPSNPQTGLQTASFPFEISFVPLEGIQSSLLPSGTLLDMHIAILLNVSVTKREPPSSTWGYCPFTGHLDGTFQTNQKCAHFFMCFTNIKILPCCSVVMPTCAPKIFLFKTKSKCKHLQIFNSN